jgi:hypothetical protein
LSIYGIHAGAISDLRLQLGNQTKYPIFQPRFFRVLELIPRWCGRGAADDSEDVPHELIVKEIANLLRSVRESQSLKASA